MSKKHTYNEVKEIINKFGFELISKEYLNNKQKLILRDTKGYFYVSCLSYIQLKKIPRKFHRSNPYTIQNIKLWCKLNDKSFQLVSENYLKNEEKIIFKDDYGYLYLTYLNTLVQGHFPEKFHVSNSYTIYNIKLWCKLNDKPFELLSDIYKGSDIKLKWKCLKENCKEEFEMNWEGIYSGNECNYCCVAPRQVSISNCLATKYLHLASEWHPTKNGDLTPWDVTWCSGKEVWWQCKENPKHEWYTYVSSRTNLHSGCPYCAGRYATEENNLLICNPELCEEWDYRKNDKLPEEYTPNSGKYTWWKCKECNHEWYAQIYSRNNGIGCPECNLSKGEKRCKEVFLFKNFVEMLQEEYNKLLDVDKYNITYFIPQMTFDGLIGLGNGLLSYDFYIPKYNLLIEYQGEFHDGTAHQQSEEDYIKQQIHDKRKKEYTLQNGYNFLEIWYWQFDQIEEILNRTLLELKECA